MPLVKKQLMEDKIEDEDQNNTPQRENKMKVSDP